MRYLLLVLLSYFSISSLNAQDYKAAKKALNVFEIDKSNHAKLDEAVAHIQGWPSAKDREDVNFYLVKGKIMMELAHQIIFASNGGKERIGEWPNVEDPAVVSFEALATAYEITVGDKKAKKSTLLSVLNELKKLQGILYNFGITQSNNKNYESSYRNFNAVILADEILSKEGEINLVGSTVDKGTLMYTTGLAALSAGLMDEAFNIFKELRFGNTNSPEVYEALVKIYQEKDPASVPAILKEGRELYPDDWSLLFADINHDLATGNLGPVVAKLEQAISMEPANSGLLSTLGSVYDNLQAWYADKGDNEMAKEYRALAIDYYDQALAINSNNFDALYGLGAIYYNKAASVQNEILNLPFDNKPETLKQESDLKFELVTIFTKALPYFEKAESLDQNDIGTLTALIQIHLNLENMEAYLEFKRRLDVVKKGALNATPYHQ